MYMGKKSNFDLRRMSKFTKESDSTKEREDRV